MVKHHPLKKTFFHASKFQELTAPGRLKVEQLLSSINFLDKTLEAF
jgi:hypothetical protein